MRATEFQQAFILHFGEMGSRWGINRTIGQIYALLYLSPEPINAEQITEALGMSRSNVSMGLKELQSWGLLIRTHKPGDRRDYFATPIDGWEILRILATERRKREIDPTLSMLRQAQLEEPGNEADAHAQARMRDMLELIELVTGWVDELSKLDEKTVKQLMVLGGGVKKLVQTKDRLLGRS